MTVSDGVMFFIMSGGYNCEVCKQKRPRMLEIDVYDCIGGPNFETGSYKICDQCFFGW